MARFMCCQMTDSNLRNEMMAFRDGEGQLGRAVRDRVDEGVKSARGRASSGVTLSVEQNIKAGHFARCAGVAAYCCMCYAGERHSGDDD